MVTVLNLGKQCLTGVFSKNRKTRIASSPLELVKCREGETSNKCGLLQLKHSVNPGMMYGENYGYRSGINTTMTDHLHSVVKKIADLIKLQPGDVVLDIGSNDSTLLKAYHAKGVDLVGIDPAAAKFKRFYPDYIKLIADYFSADLYRSICGNKKAKAVTSIAVFYDLEEPLKFANDIKDILDNDGIWVLEQSYMPTMLKQNAYDTICHEHLEYYGMRQIKWIIDMAGLKIVDVELNNINGGSFSIIAAKKESQLKSNIKSVDYLLELERNDRLDTLRPYIEFKERVFRHRDQLMGLVRKIKGEGRTILGYGASTKGNVILQFCGLDSSNIRAIAERNPEKYGRFTPGTGIAIISEEEARKMRPEYFLALPWHFKEEFLNREKEYLEGGGAFLFPLPTIESVRL